MYLQSSRDSKPGAYAGLGFESPQLHSRGCKAFDVVGESGINANNIVRFERVSAPVA